MCYSATTHSAQLFAGARVFGLYIELTTSKDTMTNAGRLMDDYQLLPCNECGMFKLCTLSELSIIQQQLSIPEYSPYICPSCTEICLLHSRIREQNDSIRDLNERISSLINIHDLEKDVDIMSAQLYEAKSQAASPLCSNPVANGTSHFNADQFFTSESPHHTNNINKNSFIDITPVQSSKTPLPTIHGIIKPDVKDIVILSETDIPCQDGVLMERKTSCSPCIIDIDGNGPQSKAIAERNKIETISKFKDNTIVTNMVVGDETLKDIQCTRSDVLHLESNDWFKVARRNALLHDLIDTVLHFGKLHKKLSTVYLQITKCQIEDFGTEQTKRQLEQLISDLKIREINLTILCPIPYCSYSDESYSRALTIIEWLKTLDTMHENLSLIDISTDLQQNRNLFNKGGNRLSYQGIEMLEKKVMEKYRFNK